MANTTVRSEQVRNANLQVQDLKDFGVVDAGGLDITVKGGFVRDGTTVTEKSDQPLTLSNNTTNYVEITNLGVASSNTTGFTTGRIPIATVVTSAGDITSISDKRAWVIVDNDSGGGSTPPGNLSDTTKEVWISLARTKIAEDQTASRSSNSVGNMLVDVFTDATGIDSGLSSGYTQRGTPNFDVIAQSAGIPLFRPSNLATGLQGFWKLDETSGNRVDSSPNGNTLTDNNTVLSSTDDYWDTSESSADFESDNSEYLNRADASVVGLDVSGVNANLTVSAWIKRESSGVTHRIVSKGNNADDLWYQTYITSTNKFGMSIRNSPNNVSIESVTTADVNKWFHVVFIHDGTNDKVSLYVNGNLEATASYTFGIGDNTDPFFIGANVNSSGGSVVDFFDGLMKDVAVWNTVLTPLQIKSLALGLDASQWEFRPNDASLTAPTSYWKLNEISVGSAITRNDSVGTNHLTDNNTVTSGAGFMEAAGADFERTNNELLTIDDASQTGLDLTTTYTMCGWVKVESFESLGDTGLIGKIDGPITSGYMFQLEGTTEASQALKIFHNSTGASSSTFVLKLGTWYHVAAVYNDATDQIRWFLDGKLVSTSTMTTNPSNTAETFRLGGRASATGQLFDGLMSDWAIWNGTALSDANIASLASGLPLQQQGLVSYYKLNEASGNATDSIGANTLTDNGTGGVGSATGQVGNARDFESTDSDYFSITDASQVGLDITKGLTVMAWVNMESSATDKSVVGKWNGSTGDQASYLLQIGGDNIFYWNLSSDGATEVFSASTSTVPVSTWTHLVGTYTGSEREVFFNSDREDSDVFSTDVFNSTEDFRIGARRTSGTLDGFMDGLVDEVLIAARYFRDEEIKTAYNKGRNAKEVTSSEIAVPSGTATVISDPFTISEIPNRALLIVNKTLNTGTITFYVSRVSSPGSNLADTTKWTPVTENAITNISGQTSGTSGRWAASITGNAELDDVAVVLGVIGGSGGGSGGEAGLGRLFSLMGA